MQCPDCSAPLKVSATSCLCGWAKQVRTNSTHPMHQACKVSGCARRVDGDDRHCGYHRALRAGDLDGYKAGGADWRTALFAEFDERHQDDAWGSAIRVASDIRSASKEDRAELVTFLKGQLARVGVIDPPKDNSAMKERVERAIDTYHRNRAA